MDEQILKELADKIAVSLISECCYKNSGRIYKDMLKKTPFDIQFISTLPDEWDGKNDAECDPERFNHILDVTMKNKLRWFNLEGFCEDLKDHYRFYTTNEVQLMIEKI